MATKMLAAAGVAKELAKAEKDLRTSLVEDLANKLGTWDHAEASKKLAIPAEKMPMALALLKEGGWKVDASADGNEGGGVTVFRPAVDQPAKKKPAPPAAQKRKGAAAAPKE